MRTLGQLVDLFPAFQGVRTSSVLNQQERMESSVNVTAFQLSLPIFGSKCAPLLLLLY